MSNTVTVVDFGIGNLFSVARAIERTGSNVRLTNDPREVETAERLLLPGVGAYGPCMAMLKAAQMAEPVIAFAGTGRPLLGICVGMQLLFDYGLEFGQHEGLGLIAGHVDRIPTQDARGERKVPHIGWSTMTLPPARTDWNDTLLGDATPGLSSAYFVHSFSAVPFDPADRLADVDHNGFAVCAAVQRDNITGFQCHPEKSGTVGLKVLARFAG